MVALPQIVSYYNYTILYRVVTMKEVMKDVAYFDKAIHMLDLFLVGGLEIAKDTHSDFSLPENKDTAKRQKRTAARKIVYLAWVDLVDAFIARNTDRAYYRVHFVRPSHTGVSLAGVDKEQSALLLKIEKSVKSLEEILIMLEERRNVVIRQEIAKKEYDSSHRYWLSYDEIAGKLYLNGNILLATTRLDSSPDRLLQQVFASPNKLIKLEGVTSTQVSSALRDLRITGTLKKIFFPRTSGGMVMFRPFITNTEFVDEKHTEISFADLRNNEK